MYSGHHEQSCIFIYFIIFYTIASFVLFFLFILYFFDFLNIFFKLVQLAQENDVAIYGHLWPCFHIFYFISRKETNFANGAAFASGKDTITRILQRSEQIRENAQYIDVLDLFLLAERRAKA